MPQEDEGVSAQTQAPMQEPMRAPKNDWTLRLPPDRMLLLAWAVVSGVLLLYLAGIDLLLHYRASRWRRVTVLDRQVLVSERDRSGTAGAHGVRNSWCRAGSWMNPAATQCLILGTEQQHLAAQESAAAAARAVIVAAAAVESGRYGGSCVACVRPSNWM